MENVTIDLSEVKSVEHVQLMCEESLSPDEFEMWEKVKEQLIKNRKNL